MVCSGDFDFVGNNLTADAYAAFRPRTIGEGPELGRRPPTRKQTRLRIHELRSLRKSLRGAQGDRRTVGRLEVASRGGILPNEDGPARG